MVFSDYNPKIVFRKFPDFFKSEFWLEHELDREDYKYLDHMDFTVFGDYIADKIRKKNLSDLKMAFDFIEDCVASDNESLGNAATTCCLENLINYSSDTKDHTIYIDPKLFVHLMGPESKAYCKAWDEFTGVKTPGLWDVKD